MSDGNGGNGYPHLGRFGLALAVLLSCLLVGGLAYLEGRETERSDQTPKAYQAAGKHDAERACVGGEPGAVFECVYEHVETSAQAAHDEQDLKAQQRAASSALVSAVFALLTMALSGLGVWYVKRTLDATLAAVEDTGEATKEMKRANEIALMGVKAQHKPHLELALQGSYFGDDGRLPFRFELQKVGRMIIKIQGELKISNMSDAPVTISRIHIGVAGSENWGPKSVFYVLGAKQHVFLNGHPELSKTLQPLPWPLGIIELTDENLTAIRMHPPAIFGSIIYEDAIGVRRLRRFAYVPERDGSGADGYGLSGGDQHNYDREIS